MQDNCFLKRKDGIAWRTIEGTTFLVNPSTKKIFPLNEVGKAVWESLEEKKNGAALAEIISAEFEVDGETAKKDLSEFLDQLLKEGLIEELN